MTISKLPLLLAAGLGLATMSPAAESAPPDGMSEFLGAKYGFFVHYVWGGGPDKPFTIAKDGTRPATFDAFADAFDAKGFARDLEKWGVEYVILTAWHYNINPLFPSGTMKKWGMPNHTCKRDVLRDVITECKAKGIKVMFYTHPRDGHDLGAEDQAKTGWGGPNGGDPDWTKFDRRKWNDFTNELYGELISRYGKDIIGIFSDEGSAAGDSYRVVDYPRLRRTVKSLQPDLLMEQNFYGTTYSLDVGAKEYAYWGEFANRDGKAWPAYSMPVATIFTPSWYATKPAGEKVSAFSAEDMFRYTVLQAGANHQGGGVQWAAGNYAGGGWETGVEETMDKLAAYIKPIAPAIKGTLASTSWPTLQGTKLPDLLWGVATRSRDDSIEYLHILKSPADGGKTLALPPPADGKIFGKAMLLVGRQPVKLAQDKDGVRLSLPVGAVWDPLDTVIALQVAPASPPVNLALWKSFRASSFPDPSPAGGSAWAFAAVDGNPTTAWSSRPDGVTEGNAPEPRDPAPWCQIDLGKVAAISGIEVLGSADADLVVMLSGSRGMEYARRLVVPGHRPGSLEIRKASYGKDGQTVDVTARVRQALVAGSLIVVVDNNLAGGDPAPNTPKELRVEYTLDGRDAVAVAAENGTLSLGKTMPSVVDVPAGTTARFVRLASAKPGPPLKIHEIKVLGKFPAAASTPFPVP